MSALDQDKHLRDLIGRRHSRSEFNARHNSLDFTEYSESPSMYSRRDFNEYSSPRAPGQTYRDVDDDDDEEEDYGQPISSSRASSVILASGRVRTPTPPRSPTTSDEDDRATLQEQDRDETPDPRMSVLGPKMKFVSRAPWEAGGEDDGDDLVEEEEPMESDNLSIFGGKGRGRGRKEKEKDSALARGLGLASFAAHGGTPRSSSSSRPSRESTRKHGRKKSSDTIATFHTYHTAASFSALPSTSSISSSSMTPSGSAASRLVNKLSMPRLRAASSSARESVFSVSSSGSSLPPPLPSPRAGMFSSATSSPQSMRRHQPLPSPTPTRPPPSQRSLTRSPSPSQAYVHPYANPDLLPPAPLHAATTPTRSDSPSRFMGASKLAPMPESISFPSSASVYSMSPTQSSFLVQSPSESSVPTGMASWGGRLISLEQAQAQARERTASVPAPLSSLAAPELPSVHANQRGRVASAGDSFGAGRPSLLKSSSLSSSVSAIHTSNDGHSFISHGPAEADEPLQQQQQPPVRTLKQRRSGFMKLFNGGKEKEKEKERDRENHRISITPPFIPARTSSTPPVPPLPPLHASPNYPAGAQMPSLNTTTLGASWNPASAGPSPTNPKAPSLIRRAPPPLSVVITSPHTAAAVATAAATSSNNDMMNIGSSVSRTSTPRRAVAPPPSPSSHERAATHLRPAKSPSPVPTSAPLTATTFQALSVRPVSTMFSQFPTELLANSPDSATVPLPPPPPIPVDAHSRSTPSPTTPSFTVSSRSASISVASDLPPATPTSFTGPSYMTGALRDSVGSSNSSAAAVISALQEQILGSRKIWQRQIWELESQVRDLKAEVEELRAAKVDCVCGAHSSLTGSGALDSAKKESRKSVVNRPRARTGNGGRSVFGGGREGQ